MLCFHLPKTSLFPLCSLALLVLTASAPPAFGGEAQGWALHAGIFDWDDSDETNEVGVEYRLAPFSLWGAELVPAFGAAANEDSGFWVHGSLRYDWKLSEHWIVTPQVGIAFYEDGDSKDLGGPLEFRSGLEVSYRFGGGRRLGLIFYHMSNSGLEEPNPGSNTLALVWGLGR